MRWSNEQRAFAVEAYFSKKEASLPHPVLVFVLSSTLKSEDCFPNNYCVKNSNYCSEVCVFILIFFIFLNGNTVSQYFSDIVCKNNVRHSAQTCSFLYSHEVWHLSFKLIFGQRSTVNWFIEILEYSFSNLFAPQEHCS
jgi:hypothetical protein